MRRWGPPAVCWTLVGILTLAPCLTVADAESAPKKGFARHARTLRAAALGLGDPSGLAFVPRSDALLVLGSESRFAAVNSFGDPLPVDGSRVPLADPINVTFDERSGMVLALDAEGPTLVAVPVAEDGLPRPSRAERYGPLSWGILAARGIAADPDTGSLYVLDGAVGTLVRVDPVGGRGAPALVSGTVTRASLGFPGSDDLRGLAFDRRTGHLHALAPALRTLYELDRSGRVVATRSLAGAAFVEPQGLAFASSGDQTDPASTSTLHVADRGGTLLEFSIDEPAPPPPAPLATTSTLIATIDTSRFSPPSPDPSGLAYRADTGRLVICDGEVDEMAIYAGANVWETSPAGIVATSTNTLGFSREPTDVVVNPSGGRWYFSDDDRRRVFEVNLGADGRLGTGDDVVTSFATSAFDSGDPEGLTFDTSRGHLIIADGVNAEIYDVDPGPNGRFDGIPPAGDDRVSHFDTGALGYPDPEGVDYNADSHTLFIVSRGVRRVLETTISGTVIREIDVGFLTGLKAAAAVVYAPSSTGDGQKSLFIADRAVDNDVDPNENDGRVFEVSIPGGPPPPSEVAAPTNLRRTDKADRSAGAE